MLDPLKFTSGKTHLKLELLKEKKRSCICCGNSKGLALSGFRYKWVQRLRRHQKAVPPPSPVSSTASFPRGPRSSSCPVKGDFIFSTISNEGYGAKFYWLGLNIHLYLNHLSHGGVSHLPSLGLVATPGVVWR